MCQNGCIYFKPRRLCRSKSENFRIGILEVVAASMAAATLGKQGLTCFLCFTLTLGEQSTVGRLFSLVLGSTLLLEGQHVALALEALWGHQTLDLGSLGVLLATLGCDLPADNTLGDIGFLVHTPELTDLVGTLGSKAESLV